MLVRMKQHRSFLVCFFNLLVIGKVTTFNLDVQCSQSNKQRWLAVADPEHEIPLDHWPQLLFLTSVSIFFGLLCPMLLHTLLYCRNGQDLTAVRAVDVQICTPRFENVVLVVSSNSCSLLLPHGCNVTLWLF